MNITINMDDQLINVIITMRKYLKDEIDILQKDTSSEFFYDSLIYKRILDYLEQNIETININFEEFIYHS